MKLIVGLGNPGREYANDLHNVGFQCVDAFARQHGLAFRRKQGKAIVASGQVEGEPVLLAKPQTYMNESGEAVVSLVHFYKVATADLLVVYDDLDLPRGRIRLRPGGGAGGHRGMQSIIGLLGEQEFPRLRVGIGRPAPGVTDPAIIRRYVLSELSAADKELMESARGRAVEAIKLFIAEGIVPAMNRFNAD